MVSGTSMNHINLNGDLVKIFAFSIYSISLPSRVEPRNSQTKKLNCGRLGCTCTSTVVCYVRVLCTVKMFKCWRARFVLLPLNVEATKRLLDMIVEKKFQSDEHQLSDDEPGEAYSESSDDEQDESGSDSAESDLHDKVLRYQLSQSLSGRNTLALTCSCSLELCTSTNILVRNMVQWSQRFKNRNAQNSYENVQCSLL